MLRHSARLLPITQVLHHLSLLSQVIGLQQILHRVVVHLPILRLLHQSAQLLRINQALHPLSPLSPQLSRRCLRRRRRWILMILKFKIVRLHYALPVSHRLIRRSVALPLPILQLLPRSAQYLRFSQAYHRLYQLSQVMDLQSFLQ